MTDEESYELMALAALHGMLKDYTVKSEYEAGNGRADLVLMPAKAGMAPIIMELKTADSDDGLDTALESAWTDP